MPNQKVSDEAELGKYFTTMLNIDDDDLDPFQYRLLAHYKRICGANGGTCFESVETTSEKTRMGVNKVRSIRKWLKDNGYIKATQKRGGTWDITLVNRMRQNLDRYDPPLTDPLGGKAKPLTDPLTPPLTDPLGKEEPIEEEHIADSKKALPQDVKEKTEESLKSIQEIPIPERSKKPPSLFDVIALEVFGLEKVNGDGAKVGAFLKNLLNTCLKYNTPEEKETYRRDLTEMYKWWPRSHIDNNGNSLHKPIHVDSICRAMKEYRDSSVYKDLRAIEGLTNGH